MGLAAYAAFIFSGLLPFRFLQRASTEACDLMIGNMEMLKSVSFPLPFVSLSAVGALLVEFAIQCVLMVVLLLARARRWPGPSSYSVAVGALVASALGASWLISVAGYLLRDLQEVLGVLFAALIYVSPTMYPPDATPGCLQVLIRLNPLTHYVIVFRDLILPGRRVCMP